MLKFAEQNGDAAGIKGAYWYSAMLLSSSQVDTAAKWPPVLQFDHLSQSHKPRLVVQRSERVRDRGLQGLEEFLEPTLWNEIKEK